MSLLSFVNNIKVSKIVIITAAVPIIMAVILGGVLTYERFQAVESVTRLQALVTPIPIFSDFLHEPQKERGVTAVFLSSNGEKFAKELQDQELLSNLVFEDCWSCGDLVWVCGFNSVFERDASDDFGEIVKAA